MAGNGERVFPAGGFYNQPQLNFPRRAGSSGLAGQVFGWCLAEVPHEHRAGAVNGGKQATVRPRAVVHQGGGAVVQLPTDTDEKTGSAPRRYLPARFHQAGAHAHHQVAFAGSQLSGQQV